MAFENLLWTREGEVVTVTVNRPSALNALDQQTVHELLQAVRDVHSDPEIRSLIITGSGNRAFIAGADISAMAQMEPKGGRAYSRLGHSLMYGLEELEQPVVAAVGGYCLGGGLELALACDFIIAAETARFGQPEINLGVIPGFGGTQRLTRRVGVGRARELVYLGDPMDAKRALEVGLVDRVVPRDQLQEESLAFARALAAKAPVALSLAKRTINSGLDMDLASGCRLEVEAFATTFATEDKAEGMGAFLEKRPAVWRGR